MAAKQFTSGSRARKPVEFVLDDDEYVFTPPKVAGLVLDAFNGDDDDDTRQRSAAQAAFDWLYDGLPEDDADRIVARLRDPDDPLDLPDLVEVIKWLLSKVSGRPTTSRRG